MEHYEKSIIPLIESVYANLTPLEKTIADFFIHNREEMDFSSRNRSLPLPLFQKMRFQGIPGISVSLQTDFFLFRRTGC